MNIFILDSDPYKSAEYYFDKHVVKMPLETAQILCTVANQQGLKTPYKSTHINHPCVLWAKESKANFAYLISLGMAICYEYEFRYGKRHKCRSIILDMWVLLTKMKFPTEKLTNVVLAMPEDCKTTDPIQAYRNYYIQHKQHLASWKGKINGRNKPHWYVA